MLAFFCRLNSPDAGPPAVFVLRERLRDTSGPRGLLIRNPMAGSVAASLPWANFVTCRSFGISLTLNLVAFFPATFGCEVRLAVLALESFSRNLSLADKPSTPISRYALLAAQMMASEAVCTSELAMAYLPSSLLGCRYSSGTPLDRYFRASSAFETCRGLVLPITVAKIQPDPGAVLVRPFPVFGSMIQLGNAPSPNPGLGSSMVAKNVTHLLVLPRRCSHSNGSSMRSTPPSQDCAYSYLHDRAQDCGIELPDLLYRPSRNTG